MTMFNDYTFQVEAKHPSAVVSCNDGKVSATRSFLVRSEYAQELGLRLLGKWNTATYTTPILPAEYPSTKFTMVAKSFSIEYISTCLFNVDDAYTFINDLESTDQIERYWPIVGESDDSFAVVNVNYSEPDWDCVGAGDSGNSVKENTAISVQINPAYEMFTLPNRNLVWADLASDRELKADSFAYKIVPKSDVIVSWYNIPVLSIPTISENLKEYRGTVNNAVFGSTIFCDSEYLFQPETLLFIDFEEDRSKRTTGFGKSSMDTTMLKLHFKEKDIVEGANHWGWNHLFLDHSATAAGGSNWARVNQKKGPNPLDETDLFELIDFTGMFTW